MNRIKDIPWAEAAKCAPVRYRDMPGQAEWWEEEMRGKPIELLGEADKVKQDKRKFEYTCTGLPLQKVQVQGLFQPRIVCEHVVDCAD
jgi:hypothetical protein